MASIKIQDLNSGGFWLFADPESYLDTVTDSEMDQIRGGSSAFCVAITLAGVGFAISAVAGYYARP